MKRKLCHFALFVFLFSSLRLARAQSGSPEAALEEIATAEDVATVIKHLPVKVQEYIEKQPKKQRDLLMSELPIKKKLEREGGTLTRTDDGSWELVEKEGGPKTTLSLKKTFVAGSEALLQMEVTDERHGEKHTNVIWIGMRFEADEWRLSQVGEWHGADIEAEFLRKQPGGDEHDFSAASTLRTLNTAIITYITTYPDAGYPNSLQVLSGKEGQDPSPEHAILIDPTFLKDPVVRSSYEFRYLRNGAKGYQITATPVQFGQGLESFFTDESAVIRFTKESRPATASDPPLD
jgi:type IV pilus assembly protein PilA